MAFDATQHSLDVFLDDYKNGLLTKKSIEYAGSLPTKETYASPRVSVGGPALQFAKNYSSGNLIGQYPQIVEWTAELEAASIAGSLPYTNNLSVELDGIDDYLSGGDIHDQEINQAFSVSFWIKANAHPGGAAGLVSKMLAAGDGWELDMRSAGAIRFLLQASVTGGSLQTVATVAVGAWTHVVATFDGSSNVSGANVYLDNATPETGGATALSGSIANSDNFTIGALADGYYFDGFIDEVSIWDKELNATEVSELYNSGTPADAKEHSAVANLVSYYRLGDGDSYPTFYDDQGSLDLTAVNTASSIIQTETP